MDLFSRMRAAFSVGSTTDSLGRSLLVEQFRVLRKQVPVLYAVLLIDSISVGLDAVMGPAPSKGHDGGCPPIDDETGSRLESAPSI